MAKSETAVLGGGCFWCLEAVYEQMKGVQSVESGFMGGKTPEPTYRDVCGGSRARAFAVAGDPCGEDPLCPLDLFAPAT